MGKSLFHIKNIKINRKNIINKEEERQYVCGGNKMIFLNQIVLNNNTINSKRETNHINFMKNAVLPKQSLKNNEYE